jgi:F-type H+-transporting ATPase subunit delta
MNHSQIAVRYSRALFQAAQKQGLLDLVLADMELMHQVCRTTEARTFLENPVIVPAKKEEILMEMFRGKVQDLSLNLIKMVIANRRETFLEDISRKFITDARTAKGITLASLKTAVKLNEKMLRGFTDFLAQRLGRTIEMETLTDEELIGGFVLRVDDELMDASVQSQLKNIRKKLVTSAFDKKL